MKYIITILFAFTFLLHAGAQTLQTKRKTVVFKHTADWCDVCGEWGWLITDSLLAHQKNNADYNAYLVALHDVSDQNFLNAEVCTARVYNAIPGIINAYPSFVVDHLDINTFEDLDFMANTDDSLVAPAVDSLLYYVAEETSAPANVAIGFSVTVKDVDSLVVQTRVKFLNDVTGQYRVAVYVLEDSVTAYQESIGGAAKHRMILRDAAQYDAWGKLLTSSGADTDDEFDTFFRRVLPPTWNKNRLRYIAIVYKKNSAGMYEIENATMEQTQFTSQLALKDNHDIEIFPSPAREFIRVRFPSYISGKKTCIALVDMTGREVCKLYDDPIMGEMNLPLPQDQTPGVYFLHVVTSENILYKRLIID